MRCAALVLAGRHRGWFWDLSDPEHVDPTPTGPTRAEKRRWRRRLHRARWSPNEWRFLNEPQRSILAVARFDPERVIVAPWLR